MSEELNTEASGERSSVVVISAQVKQIIEALLFASDEPVTLPMLRAVFDDVNRDIPENEKTTASNEEIRSIVDALNAEYSESNRAYRIQQIAGGYVYSTDKKFATWVGKLFKEKARRKLSQTAVETLAIIAYKQPITKSEVEFIRGVNADYIMKTLLEKNLATIVGRAHSPGRPLLYGTTPDFLKHFGLNEITDLPKPREIEELLGETELEVEKRMLADQQEIEFKGKLEEKLDPNSRAPHIPRKKSKLQQPPGDDAGKTVIEKTIPPRSHSPVEDEMETKETVESGAEESVEVPSEVNDALHVAESDTSQQPVQDSAGDELIDPAEIDGPMQEIENATAPNLATPEVLSSADNNALLSPEIERIDRSPEVPSPEVSSTEDSVRPVDIPQPLPETQSIEEHETEKGWSRWKTKVKTFFRKLFG